jgi:hypothetical protein
VCSKGFSFLVEILMQEMDSGSVFLSPPLLGLVPSPSLMHYLPLVAAEAASAVAPPSKADRDRYYL